MPSFSKVSKDRLATCHSLLQKLFNEVVKEYDCIIVCGYRGEIEQNRAYKEGKSKLMFPKSKHNLNPSLAVDAAPYINGKIDWDTRQVYHFIGYVKGIAKMMGIELRFGADFNSNGDVDDDNFKDPVHVELIL